MALWLLWGAITVFRESGDHLMDRELSLHERQQIVDCVLSDPQILGLHDMRTRASGSRMHVQMHVDLDPEQTLDAAHQVVDAAEARLMTLFPHRRHHHPPRPCRQRRTAGIVWGRARYPPPA